jgi:hypothetical protein
MEQSEVYFRELDRLVARENFLEKEMLDADVRHLGVRTGFFDKLAVLAAGSLALGISFMASGYEHASVQHVIQHRLIWLSAAMISILFSLSLCLLHNILISRAIFLLSAQLENVYHGAQKMALWARYNPNMPIPTASSEYKEIESHDKKADRLKAQKDDVIKRTKLTGICAVVCLILGYAIGLAGVISIVASVK